MNAWEIGSTILTTERKKLTKTPAVSFFQADDDTKDIYCMPDDHSERGQGVGAEEDNRNPLYKGPPTNYNTSGGLIALKFLNHPT